MVLAARTNVLYQNKGLMNVDKQLLEKYFKGNCTAAEQLLVEAYLQQETTPEMDEYLRDTWQEVMEETETLTMAPVQKKVRGIYRPWYSAAAAILVLIIAGAWLWQSRQLKQEQMIAVQRDSIYNSGRNIRLATMPDGSKVWLNAHTLIVYNYNYNDTTRELWINGEAFFEVAHDDTRPFRVHAGKLVVTALGTTFNIATNNRADSSIAVSLVEGKVAVSTDSFNHVLTPGQMLLYRNGIPPVPVARFATEEVLDWKNGKLIFENATLEDAFAKLQSRYGCRIILENEKLAKRKVTGSFTANETLDRILATLHYVHGFTFVQTRDKTYTIRPISSNHVTQ